MDDERFLKGEELLAKVTRSNGQAVIDGLSSVSPELGRFIVEFAYGDVMARTGLDIRVRELATLAMLGALGGCDPQLKVHIHGALNVGCTRTEIVETLLQIAVYAGFPRAINAMQCARQVFSER